jgi:hypothetical protein
MGSFSEIAGVRSRFVGGGFVGGAFRHDSGNPLGSNHAVMAGCLPTRFWQWGQKKVLRWA